jgi:energy-coupling factor transporter ATP-binding protein EcfA2
MVQKEIEKMENRLESVIQTPQLVRSEILETFSFGKFNLGTRAEAEKLRKSKS